MTSCRKLVAYATGRLDREERQEALSHSLAFQVKELLGGSMPHTIQPGYSRPFADVEDELLSEEGF
jgi:hypothetical protein